MRKWLGVLIIALACLGLLQAGARAEIVGSGECGANGDNVTWTLDDEGKLTISGTGEMRNYSHNSAPFHSFVVRNIVIENGVTGIGNYAFYDCTGATSMTIPDSVTSIGDNAFFSCSRLTDITIPDSVTSIGNCAFFYCDSLTSVTIPDSVTSVGYGLFGFCDKLIDIIVGADNQSYSSLDGVLFNKDRTVLLSCTGRITGAYSVPQGVASIGRSAFSGCRRIKSITLPNSLRSISDGAFYYCTSLTSITVPDGLTSIGDDAFYDCQGLTSISLPDSVTSIGYNAFKYCYGLMSIRIPDSVTSIHETVFTSCSNLSTVVVQTCNSYAHQWAKSKGYNVNAEFHQKSIIDEEILPTCTTAGLTQGSHCEVCGEIIVAQQEIPSLWAIETRDGKATITRYNGSADRVTIPRTLDGIPVVGIANGAFPAANCPARVYIPDCVTSIGQSAFSDAVIVYCEEFTEADYWGGEVNYPRIYTDDVENGTFYTLSLPASFRLECGHAQAIDAEVWPLTGREQLIWSNSQPEVVSLDGETVAALKPGVSTISLRVGGKTGSFKVTAWALPDDFALSEAKIFVVTKETAKLAVVDVTPVGADLSITWTSSDEGIATVSQSGLITAKRIGTVFITAASQNGIERRCVVEVCYPPTEITFDQSEYSVVVGGRLRPTVTVVTRDGVYQNKLVSFESSDSGVATVAADGTITGVAPGTATITASGGSASASCTVTIREPIYMILPAGLTAIEPEAFMGDTAIEAVIIPDGCVHIGSRAFANCPNLVYVRIPASVASIPEDVFSGSDQVVIERAE